MIEVISRFRNVTTCTISTQAPVYNNNVIMRMREALGVILGMNYGLYMMQYVLVMKHYSPHLEAFLICNTLTIFTLTMFILMFLPARNINVLPSYMYSCDKSV